MKVGVLGGTFDPIHLGHIAMAEAARDALGLAEVLLVPAGQPISKVNRPVTTAEHRISMLRLAVQDKPGLTVSTIEIERPGPSYTVDTMAVMQRHYGNDADIYFILGWDSLALLPEWKEPARLIRMCRLVAVPRPGRPRPDMEALERLISGLREKVTFLEKPYIDISATDIKKRAGGGEKIDHLVPGPVAEYIKKHKLYLTAGGET